MRTHQHSNGDARFLLVELRAEQVDCHIEISRGCLMFSEDWMSPAVGSPLPAGKWAKLGVASELSEDQAQQIVRSKERHYVVGEIRVVQIYKNYQGGKWFEDAARPSVASLCHSLGFEASTTLILQSS